MRKFEDKLDQLLNEKLSNYEVETSQEDWSRISNTLNTGKRGFNFSNGSLWLSSIIIAIVTITGLFYLGKDNQSLLSANSTVNQNNTSIETKSDIGNSIVQNKPETSTSENTSISDSKTEIISKFQSKKNQVNNKSRVNSTTNPNSFEINLVNNEEQRTLLTAKDNEPIIADNLIITETQKKGPIQETGDNLTSTELNNSVVIEKPEEVKTPDSSININIFPDKKRPKLIPGNWILDLSFAPGVANNDQKISSKVKDRVHKDYNSIVNSQEKGNFGYTASAKIGYLLGKGFSISSGLSYSKITKSVDYDFTIADAAVIQSGRIVGYYQNTIPVSEKYSGNYSLSYISIPVIAQLSLPVLPKTSATIGIGTHLMRLVSTDGSQLNPMTLEVNTLNTYNFRKNSFSLEASTGLAFDITKRMNLYSNINWNRIQGSALNKESGLLLKPWTLGLNSGIRIKLF